MNRVDIESFTCCRPNYERNSYQPPNQHHPKHDFQDCCSGNFTVRPPKITVSEMTADGLVDHSCIDFDDDEDMIFAPGDINGNSLCTSNHLSHNLRPSSLTLGESERAFSCSCCRASLPESPVSFVNGQPDNCSQMLPCSHTEFKQPGGSYCQVRVYPINC